MVTTSARLLRLLALLQARRAWPGGQLARRLEVSARTLRRDVDRLRELGYPVAATSGTAGGYRLGAGSGMPPLLLDDEEAVAVAVGLRSAAAGAVRGVEETSVAALAKLEQMLPPRLRPRVAALGAATAVVAADGPGADGDVLAVLAGACRQRQLLRFDYRDRAGARSVRRGEPYRLVLCERRWYLVAFDTDRGDWRIFRVDRLSPRQPTGPGFAARTPPADDVAGWLAERVGRTGWPLQARVWVAADAASVAARVGWAGLVEAVDESSCLLRVGADDAAGIAGFLGLLGVDFRVEDPPELVEAVRAVGHRYLRAAGAQVGGRPPGPAA